MNFQDNNTRKSHGGLLPGDVIIMKPSKTGDVIPSKRFAEFVIERRGPEVCSVYIHHDGSITMAYTINLDNVTLEHLSSEGRFFRCTAP
jgi:hypothetical protein